MAQNWLRTTHLHTTLHRLNEASRRESQHTPKKSDPLSQAGVPIVGEGSNPEQLIAGGRAAPRLLLNEKSEPAKRTGDRPSEKPGSISGGLTERSRNRVAGILCRGVTAKPRQWRSSCDFKVERSRVERAAPNRVGVRIVHYNPCLTYAEAARYLSIAPGTLRNLICSGDGPRSVTVGKAARRFRQTDLDAYLDSRVVDTSKPSDPPEPVEAARRKRGRPTKAEQARRRRSGT